MKTAAVILAAGASTRFGSPKQLAPIGNTTMLEAVVAVARNAGLDLVIAVTPPGLVVSPGVVPVINDAPEDGLSRSLRIGLAAVPADVDAALILLGDQPTVAFSTVRAVLANAGTGPPMVAARADGRLGPPVLLRREAFPTADAVAGDEGLRTILIEHADLVAAVDIEHHAPDVDTPADLAALGEPCQGCGALFEPVRQDATHAYIGASPACWAAFGELLAREFGDPDFGWIHRHTVDTYT
ncbi:MAG: nucleotidyltransferase family protein, partial [Chloroflexota bacterium]|nr:nucleotidyltransferase family protein [Chloroflexota bacterium]